MPTPFESARDAVGTSQSESHQEQAVHEPVIAPGMNTSDPLEEQASPDEVQKGDSTSVTRLYLDRTPQD